MPPVLGVGPVKGTTPVHRGLSKTPVRKGKMSQNGQMSPALLRGTGLLGMEQHSSPGNLQCSKEAKEGKNQGVPNTGRLINKMKGKHRQ